MPDIPANQNLMTLKEVCNYLGVTRYTIYRLIKDGQLPASRVGGQWRFRRSEVEEYLSKKKFRYGLIGVDHWYFSLDVLNKYRQDTAKYYLNEQAYDGWVGSRKEYYDSYKDRDLRTGKPFVDIHYRKVAVRGGYLIVLTPRQYEDLPSEEHRHWMNFLIHTKHLSR